jgi:hypothetical protein
VLWIRDRTKLEQYGSFHFRGKNMLYNERKMTFIQRKSSLHAESRLHFSSLFTLLSERSPMSLYIRTKKPYGFFSFLGDVFMTIVTAGFWLIWIFVREMRGR